MHRSLNPRIERHLRLISCGIQHEDLHAPLEEATPHCRVLGLYLSLDVRHQTLVMTAHWQKGLRLALKVSPYYMVWPMSSGEAENYKKNSLKVSVITRPRYRKNF